METGTIKQNSDTIDLFVYGYKSNKWLKAIVTTRPKPYYFNVCDDFVISDITNIDIEWDSYGDNIIRVDVVTKCDRYYSQKHQLEPYNPTIYSFVDTLIRIAETLDLDYFCELHNNDIKPILELAKDVEKTAEENNRLLKIVDTGSILSLAKTIDKKNQEITELKETLASQDPETYEDQISLLESDNSRLKLEKGQLELETANLKAILHKVRTALTF